MQSMDFHSRTRADLLQNDSIISTIRKGSFFI
jgi:hypothetical protein